MGEITHSFRAGATESVTIDPIIPYRAAEPFEKLRLKIKELEIESGSKPKIFLAAIGSIKEYKARADFSRGFFEIVGFDVLYPKGFETIEEAVAETINSNSKVTIICSTDEKYREIAPKYVSELKEKDSNVFIILAGYPKDKIDEYKKNGVDEFIYLGVDAYSILSKMVNAQ